MIVKSTIATNFDRVLIDCEICDGRIGVTATTETTTVADKFEGVASAVTGEGLVTDAGHQAIFKRPADERIDSI